MSATAPSYPGYGRPCNGCGLCCIASPCGLARDYAGVREGPCPCLERDGDRWRCGLVVNPHKHVIDLRGKPWADEVIGPLFAQMLGIGRGCDAVGLDWTVSLAAAGAQATGGAGTDTLVAIENPSRIIMPLE